METNNKPYTQEEYKDALDAVYNFHARCYETVRDYLKRHGKIEIDPEYYDDWRFDFLEFEDTLTVHGIEDIDGPALVCYDLDGVMYVIDWEQINHDMVVIEKIMGIVLDGEK